MRRHGLQAPLDPHQLASWVMFFALVSGVYVFYMPFVENMGTRWFLVAIYSILVIAITGLDLYTSYLDPSDPGLSGATDGEYFCGLCQASVARNSKHCRACDRCVEGFDHHCKWLNNCVGTRNYWHFFALISSTVSLLVLQLAWGLWLFVRSFRDRAEMRGMVADKYGRSVAYAGWQAALAAYMALLVISVVMLGELFCFHVILISKGMTTYDYIIAQRDAKLAAPPPRASHGLTGCRSGRVADTATARRKVKVGINPCALIKTAKPPASTSHWDAASGKAPLGSGHVVADSTTSLPIADKAGLDMTASAGGSPNGSLGAKKGVELASEKISAPAAAAAAKAAVAAAAAAPPAAAGLEGGVQGMVSRAVAEQLSGLREAALLAGHGHASPGGVGSAAGPGPGSFAAQGCVPECSSHDGHGHGGARSSPDFHSLGHAAAPGAGASGIARPDVHGGPTGSPPWPAGSAGRDRGAGGHEPGAAGVGPSAAPVAGAGVGAAGARAKGGAGAGLMVASGGGGGFDGAMPGGRHLGGHAAEPPNASTGAAGPGPLLASPLSPARPGSLPPLRVAAKLPQMPPHAGVHRSLLFPAKTPTREGGAAPQRELPATPE